MSVDTLAARAVRGLAAFRSWLLQSGIQSDHGYFYDWYELDTASPGRPYPEITGYGTSTLTWLYRLDGDEALLERAGAAAGWLVSQALHPSYDLVFARGAARDAGLGSKPYLYAFDTGMAGAGLTRLEGITEDATWAGSLERIVDALSTRMRRSDGTLWPLLDPGSGQPVTTDDAWSCRFSGYQAKTVSFLSLNGRNGSDALLGDVVRKTLEGQRDSGAFPGYADGQAHLHPHFYALEGLLVSRSVPGLPPVDDAVVRGYLYAERLLAANGFLPTLAHDDQVTVAYERVDALAQFVRLGCLLVSMGWLSRDRLDGTLDGAASRLLDYQVEGTPHNGGFLFGRDADGTPKPHVNSWGSFFAGQALHWLILVRDGAHPDPGELV
ncbi:MAG TPA: hypothetical protein VKD21_16865 [Acidimicrobiales bacterium]|nr:hypothetical protein [Acidimicrobiales bacterium]